MGATGNGLGRAPAAPLPAIADRLGADRPRLVVVEGLELATPLDPYPSLRALAAYSVMSMVWNSRVVDPMEPP